MNDATRQATIRFPDGAEETLRVTDLGDGEVRLDEGPLFSEAASYGDVILVRGSGEGALAFERVTVPSRFKTTKCVVGRDVAQSTALEQLFARVEADGGAWMQAFGGVVLVHLPRESTFDIEGELSRVWALRE